MPRNYIFASRCFSFHITRSEEPDPALFERHCHDHYELIFVTSGVGRYVVEGERYPLRPGTLFLFRPREYHYVEISPDQPYERCVVHFTPDALTEEVRPLLSRMEENAGQGNFYDVDGLPLISATVFSRFSTVRQLPREESELLARLILSEIIVTLSVTLPAPPEESEPLGIRVMRYLNDHLTEKIKLSELAQHFFVSKYYICRAFRMQNGVSILQYLTEKRVYLARQLMEQGRTAFSAGMQAGFGDYSSFYRAYTRVIGHAPTASDAPPKNDLTPTEKEDRLEED